MLVSKNLLLLISFSILCLTACQEEFVSEPELKTYPNVQSILWDHFIEFEQEANARGFNINLDEYDLSAMVSEISEDGVAGVCKYSNHQTNEIVIDAEFWNKTGYNSREYVVFHELGHCVLNRGHRETQNNNGTCASIMASGTGSCLLNYTSNTRSNYLDELFDLGN